jgi:hypothetical protein
LWRAIEETFKEADRRDKKNRLCCIVFTGDKATSEDILNLAKVTHINYYLITVL